MIWHFLQKTIHLSTHIYTKISFSPADFKNTFKTLSKTLSKTESHLFNFTTILKLYIHMATIDKIMVDRQIIWKFFSQYIHIW